MTTVSLLVPAYNEGQTLEETARRCLRVLREVADDYELILLDDASVDATPERMCVIEREDPTHVRLIFHARNMGIAATFEELYRRATKEFVFLIPGDGQFPPEALRDCMPLLARSDIVVCRRTRKDYTPYRRLISALYRLLPRLLFGVELWDAGSVKCVRREVFERIPVVSKGVFVEAERLIRAARRGYRVGRVDIVPRPRVAGLARGAAFPTVCRAACDLARVWFGMLFLREGAARHVRSAGPGIARGREGHS